MSSHTNASECSPLKDPARLMVTPLELGKAAGYPDGQIVNRAVRNGSLRAFEVGPHRRRMIRVEDAIEWLTGTQATVRRDLTKHLNKKANRA